MEKRILLINEVAELVEASPSSITRWCEESRKGLNSFPLVEVWIALTLKSPCFSIVSYNPPYTAIKTLFCIKSFVVKSLEK